MRTHYLLLSAASVLTLSASAHFILTDSYTGKDFLNGWKWETIDDPTHGRVNYVDQRTALQTNLTFATDSKFVMRADSFNIVPPSGARGRNSVRITSWKAFEESITVLDLQHMPEGCGTWPAFWSLSQRGPWPRGGEIDIIEGVNKDQHNLASLHTSPNCMMPKDRPHTGSPTSTNCDAAVNYNQGCGVSFSKPASYGTDFNNAGGGYYVVARTKSDGVRIWFWSRNDSSIPPEVKCSQNPPGYPQSYTSSIYPTPSWGPPEAVFPVSDMCDYDGHFDPHAFVFDTTFCGDWAGSDYPKSGCPSTCQDFVDNNPSAFSNAYWEVNALRVYTPQY